jgi:SAM-dependent methyltransferase
MDLKRKRFQGIFNIIRFNWHFYLFALLLLLCAFLFSVYLPESSHFLVLLISITAALSMIVSLVISFYVYDISDLYQLNWLPDLNHKSILNINAGFDETSEIIKCKFPESDLKICDFYDPAKHTEISISRARKAYPPLPDTIRVETNKLLFSDSTFDYCLAIFAAHEIRNKKERQAFFKEINRITKSGGQIILTEHLRDLNNFIAYTLGFFHFHSKASWLKTFKESGLKVERSIKSTPFITTFILEKNGSTY